VGLVGSGVGLFAVSAKPRIEIFLAEFRDVSVTVNFHVMSSLDNINTIEHVKETLLFDGHCQFVVEYVQEDVRSLWIWGCDCKVVNLSFEDNTVPVNCARVETRFVHRWHESQFSKDLIRVLFP
jgi:hypothetical protein